MRVRLLSSVALGLLLSVSGCSSDPGSSDAGSDAGADAPSPGKDAAADAPVDTGPPPPPMLMSPPSCPGDPITATDIAAITSVTCAGAMCHNLGTAQQVKSTWVNKPSSQTTRIPMVKPTDPNSSYVLYKLLGQAKTAGGGGNRMPENKPMLSTADYCKFHDWVQGGAM
jgi:hypothetical protein